MVTLKRTSYLHIAERGERERGRVLSLEAGGSKRREGPSLCPASIFQIFILILGFF